MSITTLHMERAVTTFGEAPDWHIVQSGHRGLCGIKLGSFGGVIQVTDQGHRAAPICPECAVAYRPAVATKLEAAK